MKENHDIKKTILIVDDIADNINVLVASLKDEYRIKAALSGAEALEIVNSDRPPDLILLDVMMPGMDGLEVCKRLKASDKSKKIPVIFVTALGEVADEEAGLAIGAVDYITKPVSPPLVMARVRTHLALREHAVVLEEMLSKTLVGSVSALTEIMSIVDAQSFSQASRIKLLARETARELGLSGIWRFELAAMLSQMGNVVVPKEVRNRAENGKPLTPEERDLLENHHLIARNLLMKIPRLEEIARMVGSQAESLRPQSFTGTPQEWDAGILGGQILKIVLDYDRMILAGKDHTTVFAKMEMMGSYYAKPILEAFIAAQSRMNNSEYQPVSPMALDIGMVVRDAVRTRHGITVAPAGSEITASTLGIIRNFTSRGEITEPVLARVS